MANSEATQTVDSEVACTCGRKMVWNPLRPFDHLDDCPLTGCNCRACGKPLLKKNFTIADGCPCNSARGVNHELVPMDTCTCIVCDPRQTGSVRKRRPERSMAIVRGFADSIPLLSRLDQEAAFERNDEWLRDLLREAAERIRELEARR